MVRSLYGEFWLRPATWCWFLLAGLLSGPSSVRAEESKAPMLRIRAGDAQLKGPEENQRWRILSSDHPVPFDSVVKTSQGFEGTLFYPDGTQLTLKPFTILQILRDGLRLYRGQAWFKVVKRQKGFFCETPSAIASVRGTSFSCEVSTLTWVFGHRLRREFFDARHLGNGLHAHLIATSIGLSVLFGIVDEAPGGRVPSAVKVYEGRVVVTYRGLPASPKRTWNLEAGEMVSTDRGSRALSKSLIQADYRNWGLIAPHHVPLTPSNETPMTTPDVRKRGVPSRFAPPDHPLRLMNELYDVEGH